MEKTAEKKLMDIIHFLEEKPKPMVSIYRIFEEAKKQGLEEKQAIEALQSLKDKGEIWVPNDIEGCFVQRI